VTVIVKMQDIHAARFCSSGARVWLKAQGIDVLDFIRNGVPVEVFEQTGDALALRVAAIARARASVNG
jgi:hypothetical protein